MNPAQSSATSGRRTLLLLASGALLFTFGWILAGGASLEAKTEAKPAADNRAAIVNGTVITVDEVAGELATALAAFRAKPSPVYLLAAAAALEGAGGWEDIRAERPWALAAAAVLTCARTAPPREKRPLLALAEAVLDGSQFRLRSISAQRILDGLVFRHLAGLLAVA